MKKRALKVMAIGMAFLAAGVSYAYFVETTGIGIPCLFFTVTGLYCPGCGATHMCVALLKLDFAAAFRSNAMLLFLLPFLLLLLIKNVIAYVRTGSVRLGKADNIVIAAANVLLIGFGIWRNFF